MSNGIASLPAPGTRSPEQIRQDILERRTSLDQSVQSLRGRINELTDWRGQLRKHQTEIIVGVAAIGVLALGAAWLSRRD